MLGIKRPPPRCLSSNIHHPSAVVELLQAWEMGHDVRQREADSSCQWNQQIPYKEWLLFWHSAPVLLHLLEEVMTSLDSISISMRWYHSTPMSSDTVGAIIVNMADSGRSCQRGWFNTKPETAVRRNVWQLKINNANMCCGQSPVWWQPSFPNVN